MKISNWQEKMLIELEKQWIKHKRLRRKDGGQDHQDFLTMQEREEMLDKLFKTIFND